MRSTTAAPQRSGARSRPNSRPAPAPRHCVCSCRGEQALTVRAALAEAAQHTLDLQYDLVADDETATMRMARVVGAAERGARVRPLVDDFESAGREIDLAALAATPKVQARVFDPFRLRGPLAWLRYLEPMGDRPRADQRMHDKL